MHNHKYVVCFSKSGVKTNFVWASTSATLLSVFRIKINKGSLVRLYSAGCISQSTSEIRSILIKLDSSCLSDTKITFLLLWDMLGYCPHFGMKPFWIWLLLELLLYSMCFWLKETNLPVDCLLTESVRAWHACCCLATPVNGAELKICLLYKNHSYKQNSIPRRFEMVIF